MVSTEPSMSSPEPSISIWDLPINRDGIKVVPLGVVIRTPAEIKARAARAARKGPSTGGVKKEPARRKLIVGVDTKSLGGIKKEPRRRKLIVDTKSGPAN